MFKDLIKMTRVLEIIGKRPQGGIGAFITNYQSHFVGEDIKLDYLIFNDEPDGPFDEKVRSMGSKIYVLPELRNIRLFLIWKAIYEFFHKHEGEYDIVHLHSANIAFMVFPAAKKVGIENLLIHSHATTYSDKRMNAIRNFFLYGGARKYATRYLACSVAAGDFLYGKKNRNRVTVFNNAIECEKYSFDDIIRSEYRNQLGISSNQLVIGHVGRFCEQKNQEYIIDIFKELCNIRDDVVLVFAGDGPLRDIVSERAEKTGVIDKVLFLGQRNDIQNLLMAMDVFVLPSLYEGLPVVGVEAQASGLKCYFSDTITREIELTDSLFLSIKEEPKTWAMKICKNGINDLKTRMAASEIVLSKGYDISHEASKLADFYKGIAKIKHNDYN